MAELSEQEQIRRNSLNELKKLGINPYPAALYEVNANSAEILEEYPKDNSKFQNISIAGRIMSRRIMGAASFVELQDSYGRIQLYIKRDEICPGEDKTMYNTVFKRLLDIGDIIGVTGFVFVTQMGETSIHVKSLTVLSKSLRPLPIVKEKDGVVYDAFSDPELRYRMRYVDLIVNPQVRETFVQRAKIVNEMRNYFNEQGYLEVDTPVLQSIPGGAAARPFVTHHNALDIDLYLRIANELYLKRLIVGGFAGVYEFSRNFRNEGMDRTHNPEFTAMEIYVPYKDYNWMMTFTENMLERIAKALHGDTKVNVWGNEIDFKLLQSRNALVPTDLTLSGMLISDSDSQPMNVALPMALMLPSMSTFDNEKQPLKALAPNSITVSGISILVRLVHPSKASCPMVVSTGGNTISGRLVQSLKAFAPIVTTVAGIVISASDEQLSKQFWPIVSRPCGKMTRSRLFAPAKSEAGSELFSVFIPSLPSLMMASLRSSCVTRHSSATFLFTFCRQTICPNSLRSVPFSGPLIFSSAILKRFSSVS